MNPTDIFEALEALAKAPFEPEEFGFAFAEATDNARATISKLRGGSLNHLDVEGGVLMNAKFHYPREWFYVMPEHVSQAVAAIRNGTLHELRYDVVSQRITRQNADI